MKKFTFSLDKVLDYKEQIFESAKTEHAEALANVHRQEDFLEKLWQDYRDYNDEFCENKLKGMMITEAMIFESGLRVMESEIQKATEHLAKLRDIEEAKRNAMVEAKRETATLEKLKEKKFEAYQKAVQKSEEAFIDEFVSSSRASSANSA